MAQIFVFGRVMKTSYPKKASPNKAMYALI